MRYAWVEVEVLDAAGKSVVSWPPDSLGLKNEEPKAERERNGAIIYYRLGEVSPEPLWDTTVGPHEERKDSATVPLAGAPAGPLDVRVRLRHIFDIDPVYEIKQTVGE